MSKLKYFLLKFRSYFPSQLPKGVTSLNAYMGNVILLAGDGIPDNRSTRFAVATMIMHLGNDKSGYAQDSVSMNYFVRKLRKAAANEVAFAYLDAINKEKKAAAEQKAVVEQKPELTVVT